MRSMTGRISAPTDAGDGRRTAPAARRDVRDTRDVWDVWDTRDIRDFWDVRDAWAATAGPSGAVRQTLRERPGILREHAETDPLSILDRLGAA